MYNIALFCPILDSKESLSFKKYEDLINKELVNNPTIFCDTSSIVVNDNVAIFSSFYVRQKFKDYIILTDMDNISFIDKTNKIIAIYNEKPSVMQNNIHYASHEQDITKILKDIS